MRYIEIAIPSVSMSGPPSPSVDSASHILQIPISNKHQFRIVDVEAQKAEVRKQALQLCKNALVHISHCRDASCQMEMCTRMKNLLIHCQVCRRTKNSDMKCPTCYQISIVCQNHTKQCTVTSNCPVYLCDFLKKNLHRTEQAAQGKKPNPPQIQPNNQLILAVKTICETLESPQLTAGDQQRIIQIMSSHPQLAEIFNSQRNFLQLQLNQNKGDLSDLHRQKMSNQIHQIDRIFSVLEVGSQPAKTTHSVPAIKSSLLRSLCARPTLDIVAMSQCLQLASDKTVDVLSSNSTGFPPLSLLLRYNQSKSLIPCLKSLLRRNDINLEQMCLFGHNALTLVCRYNSTEHLITCVKLLIQRGVNNNKTENTKKNALLLVCEFYRGEKMMALIQLLLDNGAYVLQENKLGDNALTVICRYYKRENLTDLIRLLLSRGVKVNCINSRKQTAIHSLCQHYPGPDLLPILKLLVEKGIDASVEDENKETALNLLCRCYRHCNLLEIIRFLVIDCGVNVNKVHGDLSHSVLVIVCYYKTLADGLMDIVRFFILQGIDVAATDAAGRNVLHILFSVCKGPKLAEVLRILLKGTQVDVQAVDHFGLKPLDVFRQ